VAGNGRSGKKEGHEALVLGLATGLSVPTAARQAGLSERTAYRWLSNPSFRRRVSRAREELHAAAVGKLLGAAAKAVNTLLGNLKAKDRAVANRAALGILAHMARGVETVELASELAELKRLVVELVNERDHAENRSPQAARNGHGPNGAGNGRCA
jgi:hypothetical protein